MNRFFAAAAISALTLTMAVPAVRAAEQVPAAPAATKEVVAPVAKSATGSNLSVEQKKSVEEQKPVVEQKKEKQSQLDTKHVVQVSQASSTDHAEKKADTKSTSTTAPSTEQAKPATK